MLGIITKPALKVILIGLTGLLLVTFSTASLQIVQAQEHSNSKPKLAYIASDLRIPFWSILKRGLQTQAEQLGYEFSDYSSDNSRKQELKNTIKVLNSGIDGLIISPISSSTSVTILNLAKQQNIPVVIADIGTDAGEYVSYIASNNFQGGYKIGRILLQAIKARNWLPARIGIIAIPQKRSNGKARTQGFLKALQGSAIVGTDIKQQQNFSYQETYQYARELLHKHPDLRALWLQGSDQYQAAFDAIKDAKRDNQVLLATFDAEPEFLTLIKQGKLVGAAMQQPFLMGETAINTMHKNLTNQAVKKKIELPVLGISKQNIEQHKSTILRNVLGQTP